MDKLNAEIVSFSNTNYFIYNENNVKIYPTKVDSGSTSITAIIPTDIIVENNNYDDLLLEFNRLGFIMPSGNTEIVKWHDDINVARTIQVYIIHEYGTKLVIDNPELIPYMLSIGIPCIYENEGIYIYLSELFDEHKSLFGIYKARMLQKLGDDTYMPII